MGGSGRVEHTGPVHRHSGDVGLGEGPEQPGLAGVAAAQRPDGRHVAAVVLGGRLHAGGEHRVRADLDEVAESRVEQGAYGVLEADRWSGDCGTSRRRPAWSCRPFSPVTVE